MAVSASRSLLIVPAPESNSSTLSFIFMRTEQELRLSDGTHVPEPSVVTDISIVLEVIFSPLFFLSY
jgi:hypothetical protein